MARESQALQAIDPEDPKLGASLGATGRDAIIARGRLASAGRQAGFPGPLAALPTRMCFASLPQTAFPERSEHAATDPAIAIDSETQQQPGPLEQDVLNRGHNILSSEAKMLHQVTRRCRLAEGRHRQRPSGGNLATDFTICKGRLAITALNPLAK